MSVLNNILDNLNEASLPVVGVRSVGGQIVIDYDGTETAQQILDAESIRDSAIVEFNQTESLKTITRNDAILFFRTSLIDADGDGTALIALYDNALAYTQSTPPLNSTLKSLRKIEETASGSALDIATNQGKARYLQLFLLALSLWS